VWPARPGQPQYGWEPPRVVRRAKVESKVVGDSDGDSGGLDVHIGSCTDELRLVGNGVVPIVSALAWVVLKSRMDDFVNGRK